MTVVLTLHAPQSQGYFPYTVSKCHGAPLAMMFVGINGDSEELGLDSRNHMVIPSDDLICEICVFPFSAHSLTHSALREVRKCQIGRCTGHGSALLRIHVSLNEGSHIQRALPRFVHSSHCSKHFSHPPGKSVCIGAVPSSYAHYKAW